MKISIITTTLNSERYIESCILSVAEQSYKDIEHIIIDGLSSDKTVEIVRKYQERYSHIKLVSEKDRGIFDAMNKGIDMSHGEWIYFLGSDDVFFAKDVLERILGENDDCDRFDFLYGDVIWGDTEKVYDGRFTPLKIGLKNICHQAIFFRRSLFDRYGKFQTEYHVLADWVYNMKMFGIDDVRKKYVDVIIAKYVISGYSSSHIDNAFNRDYLDLLRSGFPDEYVYMQKMNEKDQELASTKTQLESKQAQMDLISSRLDMAKAELDLTKSQLSSTLAESAGIYASRGWKIVILIRKISDKAFPRGSIRRKIAAYLYKLSKKGMTSRTDHSNFKQVGKPIYSDDMDNQSKKFVELIKSYDSKSNINVSVIIATYNRVDILKRLLQCWKKIDDNTSCSYEIIFSDDGSDDETLDLLKNYKGLPIVILKNEHHGASSARNHAVNKAKGELLIFTGDDIFPSIDFIEKHWSYYKKNGQITATLGRIEWQVGIKRTYLMTHITEIGCEQFGFVALPKYSEVDFRHFYTSNISISAAAIKSLEIAFNPAFTKCNFEDIELGYRLSKLGVKIFYAPDIVAYHDHVYDDVDAFCTRQKSAGEMLAVFKRLHPYMSVGELGIDIDEFGCLLERYLESKKMDLISGLGLIGLKVSKHLTGFIEHILVLHDLSLLRRLCSSIYRALFAFKLYDGLAFGLNPNASEKKRSKFVFGYLRSKRIRMRADKVFRPKNITATGQKSNGPDIWVHVVIDDLKVVDSYRDICSPLLPNVIISSRPCPSTQNYKTYSYIPISGGSAMNRYSFLNSVFSLVNYGLDFVIVSNSLELWPILCAPNIESSMIFPAKFDSVEKFVDSDSDFTGRFIRLKSVSTKFDTLDLAKVLRNAKMNRNFLCRGHGGSKSSLKIEFMDRSVKHKPVVFVFPAFMAVGGVERNTIEVMRNLKDKFDFVVITWENHTTQLGSLFHQLDDICIAYLDLAQVSSPQFYLGNLESLNKVYDPDIIWVPNSNPWYFDNLSAIRKIFEGKSMIAQDVYDTENGWVRKYDDPEVKNYDRYIAINQKIKDVFIKKYGLAEEKIDLIYSSINVEKINSLKFDRKKVLSKYGLSADKLNFAFIGRLVEQKQPLEFVKLAKKIISTNENANFIMVGDGVLGDRVDKLIGECNFKDRFKRIKFIDSLYEFTKAMDGLIVTSIYEGLPIVAIESMCLGTPIMTTDVGDLPLFVKKYDVGVVADGFSLKYLESTFKEFIKGIIHFKKQAEFGKQKCRDFFSSERAAKLTLNCFEQASPGIKKLYLNKNKKTYLPLVSVIIPSYNHGLYIRDAVVSVLSQTYENIELIVIDDGSKDNSVDILRTIKDRRFALIEQENQGAHNAINHGLGLAKGEFLTILNSDDMYYPDRIRQMVEAISNEPKVALVCSWISCIDSKGLNIGIKKGWSNMEPWPIKNTEFINRISDDFVKNLLKSNFISTTSNMFFRRQILEEIGGMRNLKFTHDWDFALRVAEKHSCKMIEHPLVWYRMHSTNTINTNRVHMLFEICWIYVTHIPIISKIFIKNGDSRSSIINLMESLNLQGNDKLVEKLIDNMSTLAEKGIINPEELLLNDNIRKQEYINEIKN